MSESQVGQPAASVSRRGLGVSILPAAAGLVLGLLYMLGASSYQVGSLAAPGPGMFPVLVGLIVTLPSLWCLVSELRQPSAPPDGVGSAFWRVPALAMAVGVFALLLKPAGFLPAATLLLLASLLVLGRRPWWLAAGVALGTAAVAYYGFTYLGVPLPAGMLG